MNAKQQYLLWLILFGFVTSHAMETDDPHQHTQFRSDDENSGSDDEQQVNNDPSPITTIELHLNDQQYNSLQEINLNEPGQPKTDETSNVSADANKKDGKTIKHDPSKWTNWFMDSRLCRGTLLNALMQLRKGSFDDRAKPENIARVDYAITEAISSNKPDLLAELIDKLTVINFPISKTKSVEAVEFLKKSEIQTQDKFLTGIMSKAIQYNDFVGKKEIELRNNIMPLVAVFLLQIKKQTDDIRIDTNNVVKTLNAYQNGLSILDRERHFDKYTAEGLLETTKTQDLIQTTLEKHDQMYNKITQIQNLLTNVNVIEKKE
jgi:hypothetical protein